MVTVTQWTGREVRALRIALRMSVRAFAAHANLSTSSIADMEAKGERAQLRHATQQVLDEVLVTAPAGACQRFCSLLGEPALGQTETTATGEGHREPVNIAHQRNLSAHAVQGLEPPSQRRGSTASSSLPQATIMMPTTGREVEKTNRRQALAAGLGVAGEVVAGVSDPSTSNSGLHQPYDGVHPRHVQPSGPSAAVAAYRELSEHLWRLYWSAPARHLFDAAHAHLRLGSDLVRGAGGTDATRLPHALALSALLTARLALFDLNHPDVAHRSHRLALAAANEAKDPTLVAVVLGHMAFDAMFGRKPEDALALTTAALSQADEASSIVRSWLHCVASEAEARAGNGAGSLRQADLADDIYAVDQPTPQWFDFFDQSRLHCFAGYAAMAAGDQRLATDRLSRALTELDSHSRKQRSVVSADLAAACHHDGDQAAHHLHEAINALEENWYGIGWDRVRQTRTLLGDSRLGRQLDQRLQPLAPISAPEDRPQD